MKDSNWQIELSCPQCGAPSALDETDRLFCCPYCRTRSYLSSSGTFQFCLPAKAEFDNGDLLFVPYWRIRGVLFSRRAENAPCAFSLVDTTAPAVRSSLLAHSLGVVPQALPLHFAFPRTHTRFLAVQETFNQGLDQTLELLDDPDPERSGSETDLRSFVGETISVVYMPHALRSGWIVDAIRGRPLCRRTAPEAQRLLALPERPHWQLSFHPTFCPSCGWDLEGDGDSAVLVCRNCASGWTATPSGFRICPFRLLDGPVSNVYLPFWRFPGQLPLEPDDRSTVWVPAFKTRPDLLLKLAHRITLWHPKPSFDGSITTHELYPVTLAAAEAGELLPFANLDPTAPQTRTGGPDPRPTNTPTEPLLVYVPFEQNPTEFFHRQARVSLFRGALRHGRNL